MVNKNSESVRVVKFQTAIGTLPPKKLKSEIVSEQCYQNTLRVIEYYPCAHIEYVEGWLVNKETKSKVLHVWCKYLGRYFDLTLELSRYLDIKKYDYYPILEGTFDDLKARGYVFTPVWLSLTEQILE